MARELSGNEMRAFATVLSAAVVDNRRLTSIVALSPSFDIIASQVVEVASACAWRRRLLTALRVAASERARR